MEKPKPWWWCLTSAPDSASIGRIAFIFCLLISTYFWFARPVEAFPPVLRELLFVLLAYLFGGKVTSAINNAAATALMAKQGQTGGKGAE